MDNLQNSALESALVEALRKRLSAARLSQREVERELRLSHGTLGNLLRGRTSLRIHHLELLGRLLGFTPDQILREALGRPETLSDPATADDFARRVASRIVDELLRHTPDLDP